MLLLFSEEHNLARLYLKQQKEKNNLFKPFVKKEYIGNYKLSNLEKPKKSDLTSHYNLGCMWKIRKSDLISHYNQCVSVLCEK